MKKDTPDGSAPPSRLGASAMPHAPRKNRDLRRTPWTTTGDGRGLHPDQERILDRAFFHVQSVTYPVSLRWVFYRLLQEGFYKGKDDYKNKFEHLISRARHTYLKEWRPDTLADETREIIYRVGGYGRTEIDHFYRQKFYVQIWFEARAMAGQFEKYTRGIDLAPMAGDTSIPFKWDLAKRLETAAEKYGKPIVVLYFGDADDKGRKIAGTVRRDVETWSSAPFTFKFCGLTEEQAKDYGVPANPEKPGYQWEALEDEAAREIITEAVAEFVDRDICDEALEEAIRAGARATRAIKKLLGKGGKR